MADGMAPANSRFLPAVGMTTDFQPE